MTHHPPAVPLGVEVRWPQRRPANGDEWRRLLGVAAPYLQQILTVLYIHGPRRGELLSLE
jgi:hypothetical protein